MKILSASAGMLTALSIGVSAHADLVINEVDADQSGTDTAEFIELFDGGDGNTSLDGYSLVFFNGSSDTAYETVALTGYSTDADGYFVVCGDASDISDSCDYTPGVSIQNGADAVALYLNNSPAAVTTEGLADALVYDTNDADDAGLLPLLNSGQSQVNEGGSGNKDGHSMQRCANGSGGARNTDSYTQAAPTPGAANNCAAPVELGACAPCCY